ncbi:MAG TPA: hypothetical protein VF753_13455, partial [Terriglobales bacterium]
MKTKCLFRWLLLACAGFFPLANALHPLVALGAAKPRSASPAVITIKVHPLNAPVTSMVTQQFTVSVGGNSNHAVTWYVDGVLGGNAT